MRDDQFEWDDEKARLNIENHDVSFELATLVFQDVNFLEEFDDRDYSDDRFNVIGYANGVLLIVTYTPKHKRIRLITARKASKRDQRKYYHRQVWND
jgi:uncharacterized protein